MTMARSWQHEFVMTPVIPDHVRRMPLIAAATGDRPSRRPVWFMRQAGRSLPEYRELRVGRGMLESCFDADLVHRFDG